MKLKVILSYFAPALLIFFIISCATTKKQAIYLAAERGELEKVREFLRDDPENLNAQDDDGKTLLYHAVEGENYEVIEFLVNRGADIDICEKSELRTPLMFAVQ